MTSSQSRYTVTGATAGQESVFVADEWRFFAENALHSARPKREMSRAALLGIGFVLGTGAVTPAFSASITSSAPAFVVFERRLKVPKRFEVLSPAEQIIAIRSLLGLNILELAAILHVQRPTIYAWQSGTATPHHENGRRLLSIHELAQRWSRMCSEPIGDWVRKPLDESGRTLAGLLSGDFMNERVIEDAFAALKIKLEEAATNSIGVRDMARRFRYKDRSKAKKESSLDRETLL